MKKITHGRLVYHSYKSYKERGSKLFIYNFATDKLECISDAWTNVIDPMNASWTADGAAIFFMGMNNAPNVSQYYSWDIFYYRVGSKENPKNLTNDPNSRNNDPKVYFGRNRKIVYKATDKSGSHIRTLTISNKNAEQTAMDTLYSSTDAKLGMPFPSYDGKTVYFTQQISDKMKSIFSLSVGCTAVQKVTGFADGRVNEKYPIVGFNGHSLFFAANEDSDRADQIYCIDLKDNRIIPKLMPFNIAGRNCSDPCVIDDERTIISGTHRSGGKGGYDLYLCDNITGEAVSLSEYNTAINTEMSELGACYTTTP